MTRAPRAARVVAHAKINLGLRILAREESGYHAIETVFARLALADTVRVEARDRGRTLDCRGQGRCAVGGAARENLAYRAAVAFAERVRWPAGFHIDIEKRIPVGGGLGGGSADAGAVLRALAALSPERVGEETLLEIAASLGSDVPFLASTAASALAWGRGERMLRLRPLPPRAVVLAIPDFAVSTADAYAWASESRGERRPAPSMRTAAQLTSWRAMAAIADNDFEAPVAARHPVLRELIEALDRAGASVAHLSGSGSTVYGVFARAPSAAALARQLGAATVLTTRTIERVSSVAIVP